MAGPVYFRISGYRGVLTGMVFLLAVMVAVAVVVFLLAGHVARRARQAAWAIGEHELLARAAASIVAGPEGLQAVLDRAREASGMDSVTLLERCRGDGSALGVQPAAWTPVAVSGRPPPGRPGEAAVMVPATGSLCLALGGRSLPTASRRSLGAFAALSAAALTQQRLATAAASAQAVAQAGQTRTLLLATVSHDLRSPLAAAKAAVSGLRCRDIRLTADDHDELLANEQAAATRVLPPGSDTSAPSAAPSGAADTAHWVSQLGSHHRPTAGYIGQTKAFDYRD